MFAGCGGLALGFEAQGFDTLGYEMVEDYCATYNRNLAGHCERSILTLSTKLPKAGVIIGGPPCQPFSVIGKQFGLKDSRDGFPAFIAAVASVQPDIWMFENVRGLYYRNRWYLDQVVLALRELGYIVDARLVNAVNYGVPQNRERVIVVGHKGGYIFPPALDYTVTAGQALGALANEVAENSRFLTHSMDAYVAKYEKASKCIRPRDLHLDRPSRTVTCRNLAAPTGDMMRIRLPDGQRRRLTVREAARLQSFPDWWEFDGDEESQFYQIGNAVPPMLARFLAGSIRAYLEQPDRLSYVQVNDHNSNLPISNQLSLPMPNMSESKGARTSGQSARSARRPHAKVAMKALAGQSARIVIDPEHARSSFTSKPPDVQQLINEMLFILSRLGLPLSGMTERRLARMAMAVLAVAGVSNPSEWPQAQDIDNRALRTRDIIPVINKHFGENISPGSYDDIRRQDLLYPVLANLVLSSKPDANPNDPGRGYGLSQEFAALLRAFIDPEWEQQIAGFMLGRTTLAEKMAQERKLYRIEISVSEGKGKYEPLVFGPGKHNMLIKAIVDMFLPTYGLGAEALYVGDASSRMLLHKQDKLQALGFPDLEHQKLPDIVAYNQGQNWLFVIEAVHTSNPISVERWLVMSEKLKDCQARVIYVTAFQDRKTFRKNAADIAWETEVWIADDPGHMVHFNGPKFLEVYKADADEQSS